MGLLFGKGRKLSYDISRPLSFRTDDTFETPTQAYDMGTDNAIESTAIERARYDGENMHITFKNGNGTEYEYPDVPEDVARRFRMAASYGRAFHKDIKPYSENA